jgi:2-oxoglutarate ferredoxin oxidoreductase subunit delta
MLTAKAYRLALLFGLDNAKHRVIDYFSMQFRVRIDRERCKGCSLCVAFCPREVMALSHSLNNRGNHVVEVTAENLCTGCRNCARVCPDVAIAIDRTVVAGSATAVAADKE